jgi:membrane protein
MWQLLKETINEWRDDNASQLAAALAYYTAVSIAPMLVLMVVVLGSILGDQQAQAELLAQLEDTVGPEGARFLAIVLENANRPTLATVTGVFSALVLLWGATNLFSQLQSSLNAIWNVEPDPNRGILSTLKERLLSFLLVIGVALLLLVALILSSLLAALSNAGPDWLPGVDWLWQLLNFALSLAVLTVLFAALFKVLPDTHIAWRNVWLGGAVTAVLFTVGNFLLSFYLGNAGSVYGAVGSVMVFLLWVYYSAQILFLGAEFTQVYARHARAAQA